MGTIRIGRFVIGLVGIAFFAGYLAIALEMPAGGIGNPGPGLWPTIVGITGVTMAAMLALEALLMGESASGNLEMPRGAKLFQVLGMLGLAAAYIVVVPILGQLAGSFIFFALVIRLVGVNVSWIRAVIYSAIAAGAIYYFFGVLLGLRLPAGILGLGL